MEVEAREVGALVGTGWRRQRRRRSVGPDGDADRGRPVDGGACARCRGRGGKAKGAGNGETVITQTVKRPGRGNHGGGLITPRASWIGLARTYI
jgi:hypothetical protein